MSKSSSDGSFTDLGKTESKGAPADKNSSKTNTTDEDETTTAPNGDNNDNDEDGDSAPQPSNTKIGVQGQELPLQSLSPQQLTQLQQQLGVEITHLQDNLKRLQVASDRFRSSSDCLSMYKKTCEETAKNEPVDLGNCSDVNLLGPKMLVPLSQSVFVDGYVAGPGACVGGGGGNNTDSSKSKQKVLVDIGTGYYVKKDVDSGIKIMCDKVDGIQKNATQVQGLLQKKQQVMGEVQEKLQMLKGGAEE